MKLKITEIVLIEHRPFSSADFRKFEVGGEKYQMKEGTFRNYISKLMKSGFVERAFRSSPAFYTISGKKIQQSDDITPYGGTRCNY